MDSITQADRLVAIQFLETLGFPHLVHLVSGVGNVIDSQGEDALKIIAAHRNSETLQKAIYPFARAWKYWDKLKRLKPHVIAIDAGPNGFVDMSDFKTAYEILLDYKEKVNEL